MILILLSLNIVLFYWSRQLNIYYYFSDRISLNEWNYFYVMIMLRNFNYVSIYYKNSYVSIRMVL
jgi:hypothetical protein